MSTRALLLRAIADAPFDDVPRLAYADWLEESGEGQADRDRASFIRSQITRPDSYAARRLEAGLLDSYKHVWDAELGLPAARSTLFWYGRGMVNSVWCTARYAVTNLEAILAACPLEVLCPRQANPRTLTELARHPAFPRVPGIQFQMDEVPAATVIHFLGVIPAGTLRILELDVRTDSSAIAPGWHVRNVALGEAIAGCAALSGLRRLDVRSCGLGDAGLMAIAESPHLGALESLDATRNAIEGMTERALVARWGERVRV